MRRAWGWSALVLVGFLAGCGSPDRPGARAAPGAGTKSPAAAGNGLRDVAEFFPCRPGHRWTYQVELPDDSAGPLSYTEIDWPLGEGKHLSVARRGRIAAGGTGGLGLETVEGLARARRFLLVLSVRGTAARQGRLEYPDGARIMVERDDLRLFHDRQEVFFAVRRKPPYMAQLVETFAPDSTAAPGGAYGSVSREAGCSVRLVFFAEGAEVEACSPDRLSFVGLERNVPGRGGAPCLHFRRVVEADRSEQDEDSRGLCRSFEEDTFYERGVGMVLLIQKVAGRPTMVWTLLSPADAGRRADPAPVRPPQDALERLRTPETFRF